MIARYLYDTMEFDLLGLVKPESSLAVFVSCAIGENCGICEVDARVCIHEDP